MSAVGGKRVLVVEDEAIVAMMVEDMLRDLGFVPVGPASTISDGVALAAREAIDVGLLDVNVQGERVDRVAQALTARNIPVLFVTGYGQSYSPPIAGSLVIDKPYTQEGLERALTRALT